MKKTVIELFAGVGGFRVAFNDVKLKNNKVTEKNNFDFVWANQWEPATKSQHAFDCYNLRFPSKHNSNVDISKVDKKTIPDHAVLVGGFPCQDYSVAHTLSKSKGIEGKKGVLWWEINEILKVKRPPFVLLENVDRLLKSPAKQRGRDFGIMLRCFNDLGYSLEWRIINAGEYGHPQRRRRIYIFAFHKSTNYYKQLSKLKPQDIIQSKGLFAKEFKIKPIGKVKEINFTKGYKDLVDVSNRLKTTDFEKAGYVINGVAYTTRVEPLEITFIPLKDIVISTGVDKQYFLNSKEKAKYKYLRGKKRPERHRPDGSVYYYNEGAMSPYDYLDLPGRTMLTSEGTTNRSTHIIMDPKKKQLRILTPVECERLNQFPDNWTNSGMPERRRYFMMGNALVCGVIKKISVEISKIIKEEK